MILERIKIHNFFRIKDSEVDLGAGLFHVFGQNKDDMDSISNGSGKSSFCESIYWALFGMTVRADLNKNDVIGPFDTYCEVHVSLKKDGQRIEITRWRNKPGEKNNEPRISIDGQDMSKHKNTDAFIASVLGFDSKVFLLAGFTNLSGESFCQLSSSNKIKTLKDALEIAKFDKYDAWCRAQAKESERLILGLEEDDRYAQVSLERLNESLVNLDFTRQKAKDRQAQRIEDISNKMQRIQSDLNTYLAGDYGAKHKILREQVSELDSKISDITTSLTDLSKAKEECSNHQKILEKKKRIESEKLALIDDLSNRIKNLLDHSSDCSYCGSKIKNTAKTASLTKDFERQKDEVSLELIDAQMAKEKTEEKIAKLQDKIRSYDDKMAQLVDLKSERMKLNDLVNQIKNLYHTYKVNEESLLELMTEKQRLEREDVDSEFDITHRSLIDNIERETKSLEKVRLEKQTLSKRVERIEQIRKIIKILKKDKLEIFIESLVSSINFYLEKICGSIECEAFVDKDALVLKYRRGSGDWQPFSVLSSGEQTKINKSVSFALNELFDIGLMIDDEGLQGLDDEGSKLILEHLRDIEFQSTVIFVSHQQDVQQFFSDAQSIVAVKEDGIVSIRR